MVTGKKNFNKKKLKDLGSVNKTPSPRMDTSPKKKGTPKAKGKDGSPRMRRRVMQTPPKKERENETNLKSVRLIMRVTLHLTKERLIDGISKKNGTYLE